MIAGVACVFNEEHIIASTMAHLFAQGIEHIWVMDWYSTDATPMILAETDNVTVVPPIQEHFYWEGHGDYQMVLANEAGKAGAEWVIPFDADEYWTGSNGRTIQQALSEVQENRVQAQIRQYVDFDHLQLRPFPWTKVAFKWRRGLRMAPGNHLIWPDGEEGANREALVIHELKFLSYEHFLKKCRRNVPWSPTHFAPPSRDTIGLHVTEDEYIAAQSSDDELAWYWLWLNAEVEESPIPSSFRPI